MKVFRKAKRAHTIYELDDGTLCRRVEAKVAMHDPNADRVELEIVKGEKKGGKRIIWVVPLKSDDGK